MLITELKPNVDQKYRTKSDAAHTAIAGSSFGGSISAYAMAARPDVFGRSAPLSAGINNPNAIALATLQAHSPAPAIRMYWSRGTNDTEAANQQYDQDLIGALKAMGYVDGTDFKYELISGALHNVANWQARVPTFLPFLFPPGS
jgi:enterochelin esterase-like enzyme